MPSFKLNEDAPILVEFTSSMNFDTEDLPTGEQHVEKSAVAINNAMNAMRNMAQLVVETLETLPKQPSQVDVEFGLKLNPNGDATLVKTGSDSTVDVKLVWEGEWPQNSQDFEEEVAEPTAPLDSPRFNQPDDAPAEYRQAVVDPADWDDDDEDWI